MTAEQTDAPKLKITVLGCGGAGGVPMVSFGWGQCDSANPKNRRRRPSILVETEKTRVLVDTTPDLRDQLLSVDIKKLDAVLYSHEHADHVHGIDDLREVNRAMWAPIDVYATPKVLQIITDRFGYVFEDLDPDKYPIYKPWLIAHPINGAFKIGDVEVVPFEQDHGYTTSVGFRFGAFAYSTDVVDMPESSFDALTGIDTWVLDCFTNKPHQTHLDLDKALAWIDRVKPKRAYLTHMGPALDYNVLRKQLPPHVTPAHDGLIITV